MAGGKIAVVYPMLIPGGGTEAVAAWTIHALQKDWQVTLITFSKVDLDTLDRFYGTQLNGGACSVIRPALPPLLARTNRFSVLKDHLMMRYCKSVQKDYDLLISIGGGVDFGRRSIQYFGLAPGSTLIKVLSDGGNVPGWYHFLKRSFMRGCESLSGYSETIMLRNTTLVTSKWAGEVIKSVYTLPECEVVYPPVNVPSAKTPWGLRQDGFLCISRISPEKKIEQAIEILKRVREKGFAISLRIVGRHDDLSYVQRIRRLCAEHNSWAVLEGVLPGEELHTLMGRFKYGINAASDEPFGIAIAEMVTAGCIVFVPDSGGQTEIVDDSRLIYRTVEEAVDKITKVLDNEPLQKSLLDKLEGREELFSNRAFCGSMRGVVDQFFASD